MIAGLFYKCFRIIQCIDNVFMEIFFPDQLEETIFFHDLHRLFIDMREDQMDILFFGTFSEFVEAFHCTGIDSRYASHTDDDSFGAMIAVDAEKLIGCGSLQNSLAVSICSNT